MPKSMRDACCALQSYKRRVGQDQSAWSFCASEEWQPSFLQDLDFALLCIFISSFVREGLAA
jgi:hypothetical protein